MGRRTEYAPGTFSWIELAGPRARDAAAFHAALHGWSTNGDGTFRLDGDVVAGIAAPGAAGPPGWLSSVTVADTRAVAARAVALGGTADGSLLTDPQGAVLGVHTAERRPGAARVNEPGALTMNELVTPDLDAARAYYEGVFGWTTEAFGDAAEGPAMVLVLNRGAVNASMIEAPSAAAHWRPCLAVDSVADAVERVVALGGSVVLAPATIPDGTLAVAADPQGAPFSLFAGDLDP